MTRFPFSVALLVVLSLAFGGVSVAQDSETPKPKSDERAGAPAKPEAAPKPTEILLTRQKPAKSFKSRKAIEAGLAWLAQHQSKDGSWNARAFFEQCGGDGGACDGVGEEAFTPGVTGLALAAFLGSGNTHQTGPYAKNVAQGIAYLQNIQDGEGCFGSRRHSAYQYNQAAASIALAEAYWLSADQKLKRPCQKALSFIKGAQNPYLAWRYGVRDGANDTSVTAWMTLALRTLDLAGLDVDAEHYHGAESWLGKMMEPTFGRSGYQRRGGQSSRLGKTRMVEMEVPSVRDGKKVLVNYRFPVGDYTTDEESSFLPDGNGEIKRDGIETLTAMSAAARSLALGDVASVKLMTALVAKNVPDPKAPAGTQDLHLHLFANLLFGQVGGHGTWRKNSAQMLAALQAGKGEGHRAGSWNVDVDPWGKVGGRVYTTAMAILSLQAPHRFPKIWHTRKRKEPTEDK